MAESQLRVIHVLTIVYLCVTCVTSSAISTFALEHFLLAGAKANGQLADSVAVGLRTGMEECQEQFRWERWNCSSAPLLLFTPDYHAPVTREAAFVRAVTSAGITHALTANCSSGQLTNCGCGDHGKRKGQQWRWSGCSDNVRFGESISRTLLDTLDPGKDTQAQVNIHNNHVGRLAVRKTMTLVCKCHGVSGSCSTRTCWQKLAPFSRVGALLKRKFAQAVHVENYNGVLRLSPSSSSSSSFSSFASHNRRVMDNSAGSSSGQRTRRYYNKGSSIRPGHLVFLAPTGDTCWRNGTSLVQGRRCVPARTRRGTTTKASPEEARSCSVLCKACGLRVASSVVQVDENCGCKFQWCCAVKCKKCSHSTEIFECQ